jgi:hypothetical protein
MHTVIEGSYVLGLTMKITNGTFLPRELSECMRDSTRIGKDGAHKRSLFVSRFVV